MPEGPVNPKEIAHYFALAQVGLEMAVPIGIGAVCDRYFGWSPWGSIAGAVLGLFGGLSHLIWLAGRQKDKEPKGRRDGDE